MSGRGGTTGRAAGWPAKFGRGCGRNGVPGVGIAPDVGIDGAGADSVVMAGLGAPGAVRATGGAGIVIDAGGMGADGVAAGMG